MAVTVDTAEATTFLESLIGKTLHITVQDGRRFVGELKCTDNESNVILANSFECRMASQDGEKAALDPTSSSTKPAKGDVTSRHVGLIVVPGFRIARLELEHPRSRPSTTTPPGQSLRPKP